MNTNPAHGNSDLSPDGVTESSVPPSTEPDPKEVFRALVTLQDRGEAVETSRARVSLQFGITREELADIEREGIAESWPPL